MDRDRNPQAAWPVANSAVVVGLSYFVREPPAELWNDPLRGRIARYAWGPDYHEVMLSMLKELAESAAAAVGGAVMYRTCVDSSPIFERDLAEQAGLGFIGRNTNLISPGLGSFVFLGEILVDRGIDFRSSIGDLRLEDNCGRDTKIANPKSQIENACGSCRRCVDACPTNAFPEPFVLDASRCISYLTIENRGSIPEELRPRMRNWIFGCDECQEACPWVVRFSKPGRKRFLKFDPDTCAPELTELIAMTERDFRERFAGTPVLRAKRRGLQRNVAIALGNSGNAGVLPSLEKAAGDAEPLVREHAAWAIGQLRAGRG